jgi:hypothetical protein
VTVDYIRNAIGAIKNKHYAKHFLVFSDDIEMAKSIIDQTNWDHNGAWFEFCKEPDPKISMCMMAGCDHNIIANSSFSWWGSYLGDQEKRTVVAPSVWFGSGNTHLDTKDIYREKWIII